MRGETNTGLRTTTEEIVRECTALRHQVHDLGAERDRLKEESDTWCRALAKLAAERDELRRRLAALAAAYAGVGNCLSQWEKLDKSEGSR